MRKGRVGLRKLNRTRLLGIHRRGNPAVHASCFGIRLTNTRLLARVALAIMIGHKPATGQLVLGVGKEIPHERTIYAGFGVRRQPNAYKMTAQVSHIGVAVDKSS